MRLQPARSIGWGGSPGFVAAAAIAFATAFFLAVVPGLARSAQTLAVPDSATTETAPVSPHLKARLLVDPSGTQARVGVLFDLEPGWHLYWKNPGDTGLPPEIAFDLGAGEVGAIHWPAPERFDGLGTGLASYGYSKQVLLASPVQNYGAVHQIAADVDVLICADECIPVDLRLERSAPQTVAAEERAVFSRYAQRVPVAPAAAGVSLSAHYTRDGLGPGDAFEAAIAIESCDPTTSGCDAVAPARRDAFFPDVVADEALSLEFLTMLPHPERPGVSLLRFRGTVEPDLEAPLQRLTGVLGLETSSGIRRHVSLDLPFPGREAGAASSAVAPPWLERQTPGSAPPAATGGDLPLLHVLLLALLGGFILNGMPCVLPVLGIKICSAAELAQHDPSELRRHGVAYLAGVLASMVALAAGVTLLKAAGTSVGWGFQFQEPLFVAGVACVVVLFALNLFGVFEIQFAPSGLHEVGAQTQGTTRSFFDGLLAVVLATPCTAPFLGTAVGFAFAGGSAAIFAIFLAIGTGLAAPYVAICWVPGWARFVPRAGNWMLRLRAGLGFLLLATAVWLVWIFGRSTGVEGQTALLAVLVALAFGSWLLGWLQTQQHATPVWLAATALLGFGVLALNQIDVAPQVTSGGIERTGDARWQAFDPAQIQAELAAGRPVFVSFTADWCITCKVNERGVLADERVWASLAARRFTTFRGDWTQRDETIRAELERHGRAGVPLYLVYDPRQPDTPQVLPELLRVEAVLEALEQVRGMGSQAADTAVLPAPATPALARALPTT